MTQTTRPAYISRTPETSWPKTVKVTFERSGKVMSASPAIATPGKKPTRPRPARARATEPILAAFMRFPPLL